MFFRNVCIRFGRNILSTKNTYEFFFFNSHLNLHLTSFFQDTFLFEGASFCFHKSTLVDSTSVVLPFSERAASPGFENTQSAEMIYLDAPFHRVTQMSQIGHYDQSPGSSIPIYSYHTFCLSSVVIFGCFPGIITTSPHQNSLPEYEEFNRSS